MNEYDATLGMKDAEDIEGVAFIQSAIPEDPNAALLIRNMISWTATYDHIVDGDPWKEDDVHDMFADNVAKAFYPFENSKYTFHTRKYVHVRYESL